MQFVHAHEHLLMRSVRFTRGESSKAIRLAPVPVTAVRSGAHRASAGGTTWHLGDTLYTYLVQKVAATAQTENKRLYINVLRNHHKWVSIYCIQIWEVACCVAVLWVCPTGGLRGRFAKIAGAVRRAQCPEPKGVTTSAVRTQQHLVEPFRGRHRFSSID